MTFACKFCSKSRVSEQGRICFSCVREARHQKTTERNIINKQIKTLRKERTDIWFKYDNRRVAIDREILELQRAKWR